MTVAATRWRPAERELGFIQSLKQTKGRWAGQTLRLLPWQERPLRRLFGELDERGHRRIRYVFIFTPRKTGKSTLAAAIANYLLFADREPGAEVYGAAHDKDQASLVFSQSLAMLEETGDGLKIPWQSYRREKRIEVPSTRSFYWAIPSDEAGSHGFNASGVIFDEFHTQRSRDLHDVLWTSTGTREQPLMFVITTAGTDVNSPCFRQYDYACKVRDGIIDDPAYLPVIYEAEDGDDWQDAATWRKAHPSLGHTIPLSFYERECRKAIDDPTYEPTFKRLFLNLWVSAEAKAIRPEQWEGCYDATLTERDLVGAECYAALDLASIDDLAALALAFPLPDGRIALLFRLWIPKDSALERQRRDGVPYETWGENGHLTRTPGNRIDYEWIESELKEVCEVFDVRECAYDRYYATQLVQRLGPDGEGLTTFVPHGQGYRDMSHPTKEFLARVRGSDFAHAGNPVVKWSADNLVTLEDPAGNRKPAKNKSREKIDPMVAGIMAVGRVLRHDLDDDDEEETDSVYETRGPIVLG